MEKPPSPGRADILAAALREFADHGLSGATTAGIARRAGITQPLVHHHFGSKQGLWSAVIAELFGGLARDLGQAMQEAEGLDPRARLARLIRALVLFAGRRPELGRLIHTESSAGGAAFEELYDRWLSGLIELFRRELGAAVEAGVLPAVDPCFTYSLLVSACTQPFSDPETIRRGFGVELGAKEVVERYADFVVSVLLRGFWADTSSPSASPRPARSRFRRNRR
jgi:TetR/AcrR family transcriptional regulator